MYVRTHTYPHTPINSLNPQNLKSACYSSKCSDDFLVYMCSPQRAMPRPGVRATKMLICARKQVFIVLWNAGQCSDRACNPPVSLGATPEELF